VTKRHSEEQHRHQDRRNPTAQSRAASPLTRSLVSSRATQAAEREHSWASGQRSDCPSTRSCRPCRNEAPQISANVEAPWSLSSLSTRTLGSWRTYWRTSMKSPANAHVRHGLENRFGPLGPTRVQIPPPPLNQAAPGPGAASVLAPTVSRTATLSPWKSVEVRRNPLSSGVTGARLAHVSPPLSTIAVDRLGNATLPNRSSFPRGGLLSRRSSGTLLLGQTGGKQRRPRYIRGGRREAPVANFPPTQRVLATGSENELRARTLTSSSL
jgi:hypothetical protein